MPIERITLEELSKISDKAVHINVSNHVRDIAEGAAKVFCDSCKYAAQKGQRSYSGYAAGQYTLHRYIFTDRSAIQENKNTIVDWTEFSTLSSGDEESISILGQHRTIAEASAVESPIRQETIGFPAHFFARAHNFKPPGRACQPEADSPMRT